MVRAQLPLMTVRDTAFVPRLSVPALHRLTMAPGLPLTILTVPSPSTDNSTPASTPVLILETDVIVD